MALNSENKVVSSYKKISPVVTLVLAIVASTVTTLSFLKNTVSEGITEGMATVLKDVDYLKREVDQLKQEQEVLRTIVTGNQTSIAVLEVNLRNTAERVAVRFIDKDFMKPDEPSYESYKPKKR